MQSAWTDLSAGATLNIRLKKSCKGILYLIYKKNIHFFASNIICFYVQACKLVCKFKINYKKFFLKILSGDYNIEKLNLYSDQINSLIQYCLIVDSCKRMDILEIAKCFVEKIITYTEHERSYAIYLERKIGKKNCKFQK